MQVEVEQTGSYMRRLTITLPALAVDNVFDKVSRKMQQQAVLPGFRRGKVPLSLLERKFTADILQRASQDLTEDALGKAYEEKGLEPVASPQLVRAGALQRGSSFSFVVDLEVCPENVLQKMQGLPIARPPEPSVTDAQVDEAILALRQKEAQTVPVTERRHAQVGDVVLLDAQGHIDGAELANSSISQVLVELGSKEYIAGFAEGLEGAEVPGTHEVPVTFPDDYGEAAVAGKTVMFTMTCKELKTKVLPELDDAFAQDLGDESVSALRVRLHDELLRKKHEQAEALAVGQATAALVAANPFEVPPSMVDNRLENMLAQSHRHAEARAGRKLAVDVEANAELRGTLRDDVEERVRAGILLREMEKQLKPEVEDSEVAQEIERRVQSYPDHDRAAARHYFDQDDKKDELRSSVLEKKLYAYLLQHAAPPTTAQSPAS